MIASHRHQDDASAIMTIPLCLIPRSGHMPGYRGIDITHIDLRLLRTTPRSCLKNKWLQRCDSLIALRTLGIDCKQTFTD